MLVGTRILIVYDLSKYIFKDAPDTVPTIFVCQKADPSEEIESHAVKAFQLRSAGGIPAFARGDNQIEGVITQKLFLESDRKRINPQLARPTSFLIKKLTENSEPLRNLAVASQGIKPYATKDEKKDAEYVSFAPKGKEWSRTVRGRDIGRYWLNWNGEYAKYGDWLYSKPRKEFESCDCIFYQRLRKASLFPRIVATFADTSDIKPLAACSILKLVGDQPMSIYTLLAILNSNCINMWYKDFDQDVEIKIESVLSIPIRRISFTTLAADRTLLVEEAKKFYIAPDFVSLLKLVDECLPKDASGNFVIEKEKSDVVHDILAFLAEQMIEMNKQKQSEIKSFLDFLKGEIGAPIEELSNKTAIQEYYKNAFQKLIDVLVKNKKNFRAEYDPKSPTSYKHLLEWYNASIDKLRPIMGKIEVTDRIIDQIVYKLYGLREEEITIVEES